MYLSKDGVLDRLIQYECLSVPQVKNTINEITKTVSTNDMWKDFCYFVKKQGGYDSCDYTYFADDTENDCTVCIGYDKSNNTYLVWIEV